MRDRENRMTDPPHSPTSEAPVDLERPNPRSPRGVRIRRSLTVTAMAVVVAMIAIGVVRIVSVTRHVPSSRVVGRPAPSPSAPASSPVAIPPPADLPSTPDAWSRAWLEPPPRSGSVLSITAGGPGLVAVGAYFDSDDLADVWTSSDGRTWSHVPGKELGPGEIDDVTAGGPGLVAVGTERNDEAETKSECRGARRACAPGFHGAVWTSKDGVTWSRAPDDRIFRGALIQAVTAGGPGCVAVGLWDRVWYSSDGVTWDRASVPTAQRPVSLTDVVASGDRLVAVGWSGSGIRTEPVIWTSTDGMTWTDVTLNEEVFPLGSSVETVEGRRGFIAVGSESKKARSAVWTSADSVTWHRVPADQEAFVSRVPSPSDIATSLGLWSVTAGSGGYVAVGTDGYCSRGRDCPSAEAAVWTSTDGEAWYRVPTGPVFQVRDPLRPSRNGGAAAWQVVPWGSRFVAVGDYDGGIAIWISESRKE